MTDKDPAREAADKITTQWLSGQFTDAGRRMFVAEIADIIRHAFAYPDHTKPCPVCGSYQAAEEAPDPAFADALEVGTGVLDTELLNEALSGVSASIHRVERGCLRGPVRTREALRAAIDAARKQGEDS
jgi:hypothetical protein